MQKIKVKRLVLNLILLFITIILFLFLFEIILRLFYPQPINPGFIPTHERDTFAEYDKLLGWKLKPNFEGVFFSSEYNIYIKNNAQGLRMSNNISLEKSKYRIAFLGDSYVWGHGVNENDRMSNILENELKNIEVLNFGVSGYTTDQYYLQLKNIVLRFDPDMVIIGFYANDLEDAGNNIMQGYPKPLFKIKNNSLELTNIPVPKRESISKREYSSLKKVDLYLSSKSHVYVFFKPVLFKIYDLTKNDKYSRYKITTYEVPVVKKVYSEEYQGYKELNDKLYCEISSLLKEKNVPLVVVNIPVKVHIFPEDFNEILRKLNLNQDDYDLNKISNMLSELSKNCNFYFIDLYPYFLDYKEKKDLYYKYDVHLTQEGNKYTAEITARELKDKQIL